MKKGDFSNDTLCVHAGAVTDMQAGGVNTPIFPSSAFRHLENPSGRTGYPRYMNIPTQEAPAAKIAALEGAEEGIVTSSGLGAIITTLLAFAKTGDHMVMQEDLYGGTHHMITSDLDRLGIEYSLVKPNPVSNFKDAIRPNTRLIYAETPSNPLLCLTDLRAVAEIAKSHGLISVVDNTFASPINQKPIELGFDVSVHSATKYLNGHSDLNCGAVATSAGLMEHIRERAINIGVTLNVLDCYLLERGIKTLALRVAKQNENAMTLATFLNQHPKVNRVYYPGLPGHEGHEIAKEQMLGYGGMLSFEVGEDLASCKQVALSLEMIIPAVSLGGVESTVSLPCLTSHAKMSPQDRAAIGVKDNLIRFSVGVENAQDLIDDLNQALARI
jgi:cystathionine beta-lyase/cystathionine gamma-synthase